MSLALLLACLSETGCSRPAENADSAPPPSATREAPGFSLAGIDGKPVRLSDYEGKVVVINFWATWCPPCRAEIPDFVKFYNENKEKGLVIIGIALEQSASDVRRMVESLNMTYPVALSDGSVERRYGGFRGIPTTFVIARDGTIARKHTGMMNAEQLASLLDGLL